MTTEELIEACRERQLQAMFGTGTYTHALTKADYDRLMVGRTRHLRYQPIQRRRGSFAAINTTKIRDFL
jgi:hypothetical protein